MCPVNVSSLTRRSVPTLLKPGTDSGFILSFRFPDRSVLFQYHSWGEFHLWARPSPHPRPHCGFIDALLLLGKKDSCFIKYISQLASLICRIVGVSCAHLLHVYFTRVSLTRPRLEGGCAKKRLLGLASKIYTSLWRRILKITSRNSNS